jgi:hypothetical protein
MRLYELLSFGERTQVREVVKQYDHFAPFAPFARHPARSRLDISAPQTYARPMKDRPPKPAAP